MFFFLQEIMGDGHVIAGEMEVLLADWTFILVDAKGRSGGLLLGWRTRMFHFINTWVVESGIYVSLFY